MDDRKGRGIIAGYPCPENMEKYVSSGTAPKTYGVLTPELFQMRNDMLIRGVSECAMESTSVYWIPVWNALCDSMELKLVNPYFIKQLPGRKSDVKDAQ